jgi:outer membrane protein insertion porin family
MAGMTGLVLAAALAVAQAPSPSGSSTPPMPSPEGQQQTKAPQNLSSQLDSIGPGLTTSVWQWKGLMVEKIEFEGVTFDKGDTLPDELDQRVGEPLEPEKMRQSLRRLFDSGRYRDIEVRGLRQGDRVTLIFAGQPRFFVGRVSVVGVRDDRLASLLRYATRLNPGTALTRGAISAGSDGIRQALEQHGFFESEVSVKTTADEENSLMNVEYTVAQGSQARVGGVMLLGDDPGMTLEEFRKKGRLKNGSRITRETTSNALERLRREFQKRNRLQATVSLQKQTYIPSRRQVDFEFLANQGPEVKVSVEGVNISNSRLRQLVPIFEESAIDNDLLNEGVRRIRDYVQQQGYFDARVDVRVIGAGLPSKSVVFTVDRGLKHKVVSVDLKGNKYFSDDVLRERMRVRKADAYMRSGRFSTNLLAADVNAIQLLYRANGFDQARVTTDVKDTDEAGGPTSQIRVTFTIEEGPQLRFGKVELVGVDPSREKEVRALMNSQTGQPFSLVTLSGDRDALITYYLSQGFEQVRVELRQHGRDEDSNETAVSLNVTEGPQVFINRVLVSGLEHTRPSVAQNRILVHPGDPLNQSALLETQRGLYDLALFNEVLTAVQNPAGNAPRKNTLVQITEARRWNVAYGFGLEVQTGYPGSIYRPNSAAPEGRPGASPRVSLDVSRINFRGTQNSITFRGTYGLIQQVALLTFTNPHLNGSQNFSASVSGGYTNIRDITTFTSETLQGNFRITQRVQRRDTFIYDYLFRRVRVDPNSLQVSIDLIPLLSQPVRVGGPSITWFHDTRSPSPLDAVKGMFTTLQFFDANSIFGSQTDFFKIDGTNANFFHFNKRRYVLGRSTRIGYQRASGANPNAGSAACQGDLLTTNASCNPVPLPERLYAGGATSHRGFPINGAGPRDLQTGYPVGGSAAFVNSIELRMPPPTLPYVGDSVSFVLFHDMGNVFQHPEDMFPSFLRFHQPDRDTCKNVSVTIGTCNFNYFSHAVGIGARYRTPVGPLRFDFSYNLNPPIYPVINDYSSNPVPHVGQANHFNFFFSIGQTF